MIKQKQADIKSVTKTIVVTPAMAKSWLEQDNNFQRSISKTVVNKYKLAMVQGLWQVTPTHSIGISSDQQVVDGQHRLAALVEYGKPLEMSVTFNCPTEIFKVLDRSYKRNLSQIAAMANKRYCYSWHIAAVNALKWQLDRTSRETWSAEDCLCLLDLYEDELSAVFPEKYSGHDQMRMASFRGPALRAAIAKPDRLDEISEFVKVVATGLPLKDGRVHIMGLMLRNVIISKSKAKGGGSHDARNDVYKASLAAIGHFLNGTQIRHQTNLSHSKITKQPFPLGIDSIPRYMTVAKFFKLQESAVA